MLLPCESPFVRYPAWVQFPHGLHFGVLHAAGTREQVKLGRIHLHGKWKGDSLLDHPLECHVGTPRLVFRIATSNIGVTTGKPYLLQPDRLARISRGVV